MHIAEYGQNVSTTELPVFCTECLFHVDTFYSLLWTCMDTVTKCAYHMLLF